MGSASSSGTVCENESETDCNPENDNVVSWIWTWGKKVSSTQRNSSVQKSCTILSGLCGRTRRARSWETPSWGPACPRIESLTEKADGVQTTSESRSRRHVTEYANPWQYYSTSILLDTP